MSIVQNADGSFMDLRSRCGIVLRKKPKDRPMRIKPTDTLRRVQQKLARHLARDPAASEGLEGFSLMATGRHGDPFGPDDLWETTRGRFRWVAAFAVTGSNEGHYIHVELVAEHGCGPGAKENHERRVLIFLGKTFGGMRPACAMAYRLAVLLDA